MKDKIYIEKLNPDDLPQLQQLYKELLPEGCPLATLKKNFAAVSEKPEYCLAAAKREGTLVGTAAGIICTVPDGAFMVVENVVVRKDCQGSGIGRKLLEHLDRFAIENGCIYSLLVSSGFRKEAHKFYENAGYTDDVRGFRKYYR
ncbi:MAG: GNAT family N-acetyltransferase [Eubacterium sp.]|nr:GNAT family N-acetyltransferase [Eubacterium sp.]